MKGKIGLWLDHRRAVIVTMAKEKEEVNEIDSGIKKHIRYSRNASLDASQEDVLDRQFDQQVNQFYSEILPYLREAETIQIFGPGEAKKELASRLKKAGYAYQLLEVTTMDKMTDRQIIAEIRRRVPS
jgi:hypothetical protein